MSILSHAGGSHFYLHRLPQYVNRVVRSGLAQSIESSFKLGTRNVQYIPHEMEAFASPARKTSERVQTSMRRCGQRRNIEANREAD
jgi:hypothetical protein